MSLLRRPSWTPQSRGSEADGGAHVMAAPQPSPFGASALRRLRAQAQTTSSCAPPRMRPHGSPHCAQLVGGTEAWAAALPVSRPCPAGPSRGGTATSSGGPSSSRRGHHSSAVIVAVIENKAKEIGIAAMDLRTPEMMLSQFSDNQTYVMASATLHRYEPIEILLPSTMAGSSLVTALQDLLPAFHTKINFVARKFFNDTQGGTMLRSYIVPERKSTFDVDFRNKYLVCSAANALIHFVETVQSVSFAQDSLKVTSSGFTHQVLIDAASVNNLEILRNRETGSERHTLFGLLNHTRTPMGKRLLRTSLLQPVNDRCTLQLRLDAVEELIGNERLFFELGAVLAPFPDLDLLYTAFVQLPHEVTAKVAQHRINALLSLKSSLERCGTVASLLQHHHVRNEIFQSCMENLMHPHLDDLLELVCQVIEPEATAAKNALQMQVNQIYAVKHGQSRLLDVARQRYTEITDDIHELVPRYQELFLVPNLKVQFQTKRGYFLTTPFSEDSDRLVNEQNADVFIHRTHQGKKLQFTSLELVALNDRLKDTLYEIFLRTNEIVEDVFVRVRSRLHTLYSVSESVAITDLMLSHAEHVTLTEQHVRPQFSDEPRSPLAIQAGRHPVLECIRSQEDGVAQKSGKEGSHEGSGAPRAVVPNDTFMSDVSNMQIITGPNMSGKSTYLKQVVLITIMAHVGSFVPAQFASFPRIDHIFTRIGSDDDMESNSSTFMMEMKEMSFIVQNVTENSLLIIDELGRGTSNVDGTCLAWSCCEELLQRGCFTLFATHFQQMIQLQDLYPNRVLNHHLRVDVAQASAGGLRFLHSLCRESLQEPLPPQEEVLAHHYGILLARHLGMPAEIVDHALQIATLLDGHQRIADTCSSRDSESQSNPRQLRVQAELAHRLLSLRHSTLDPQGLVEYLRMLQRTFLAPTGGLD